MLKKIENRLGLDEVTVSDLGGPVFTGHMLNTHKAAARGQLVERGSKPGQNDLYFGLRSEFTREGCAFRITSICLAVMILPLWLTHTHTRTQTNRDSF